MLERLRALLMRLFGLRANEQPNEPDRYAAAYERPDADDVTIIIASKLATLAFADSSCAVDDVGARSQLIGETIGNLWPHAEPITAQMLGKGGKVLVPYVHDGHVDVSAIGQNRMLVRRMDGERILDATLMIDSVVIDDKAYWLIADYAIDEAGTQTIRYRAATSAGAPANIADIPQWANIQTELSIGNTDRALFGFYRSPRDNRRDKQVYGVPITYGAERAVNELVEHMGIYRREFRLSRMMLGLDSSMWRHYGTDKLDSMGVTIDDVKRTVQDSDSPFIPVESPAVATGTPWQEYAPNIRIDAMETRYNSLLRRVEKACGLSQGILTERQAVNYANKDEVRAAQYDTYTVVCAIRKAWEHAVADLAYAVDVLAEYYGLTPSGARGQYEIDYSWDTSLVESTADAFNQLSELQSRGLVSGAELRQWVMGGDIEQAQKDLDAINASNQQTSASALSRILSGAAIE